MQRASNEWKVENAGPWNWEKNRENMTSFMDKGAERAGDKESIYTVGMRGENDGPIVATDPSAILKEVFKVQGEILQKYHGENATSLVKAWTVYKEVLTYYSNGLTPEDDTTIIFSDDNWGNVARLPTDNETSRASGFGVSYLAKYEIITSNNHDSCIIISRTLEDQKCSSGRIQTILYVAFHDGLLKLTDELYSLNS